MNNPNRFVLIRGLLREARHWGNFPDTLRQHFPDSEILTPDIPGNGRLHYLTSSTTIGAMTDALRRQTNERERLVPIGLSMGGMIAIDWMTRYPDEIDRAVLINTSTRSFSPFYRRLRWQCYPTILKLLFGPESEREQRILALTSNRHHNNSDLLDNWLQWQRQCPVSATSARNQLLAAATFSIHAKPRQPMLIVTSTADRLVDYHCSLQLHKQWQTQYRQHNSAGHDLPLDEPEWLASLIKQWLSRR